MTTKYYDAHQIYMTFEYPFFQDHLIKSGFYSKKLSAHWINVAETINL